MLRTLRLCFVVLVAISAQEYRGERTKNFDLIHTQLDLKPDWNTQTMAGVATLKLKPHFYDQSQLVLDGKSFEIKEIVLSGTVLKYTYDAQKINIDLGKTYKRTDTLRLKIAYTAQPNKIDVKGSAAITADKGLYFIVDPEKPRQIWTQGETEANSCWFPTLDTPNQKHTTTISITVDSLYKTLSNGLLTKAVKNADGSRTDTWHEKNPMAPYLTMIAVGDFAKVTETDKNLEYSYYVEPAFQPYAKAIFGRTTRMMDFFEAKLGVPYAWEKYAQIAVRDYVSGAMENATATVHGDFVQKDPHELIDENDDRTIAHELFHHWFGDLVTTESWSNLPLNESFANYSEYLWFEHDKGLDEADLHHFNEKQGYFGEAAQKREPLIRYHYADKEDMFDAHSYNKGGCVLHMLRRYVGDEAFFLALNKYLTARKWKTAEISDLRKAFEDVTGEDLNWFFDQWFLSAGHPSISVSDSYADGKLMLKIDQTQDTLANVPAYRFPLDVVVYTGAETIKDRFWVTDRTQTIEILASQKPDLVVIDPSKHLLAEVNYPKSTAAYKKQYAVSIDLLSRLEAADSLIARLVSPADRAFLAVLLKDQNWKIRQNALAAFNNMEDDESTKPYINTIMTMAATDAKSQVRAGAMAVLPTVVTNTSFAPIYTKGTSDTSYLVRAAALKQLLASGSDLGDSLVKKWQDVRSGEIQKEIADHYASQPKPEYFEWFEKKLKTQNANVQYDFVQLFAKYVAASINKEMEAKAWDIFEKMARSHPQNFVRFGAFQSLLPFMDSKERAVAIVSIMDAEKDPLVKRVYEQFRESMKGNNEHKEER